MQNKKREQEKTQQKENMDDTVRNASREPDHKLQQETKRLQGAGKSCCKEVG